LTSLLFLLMLYFTCYCFYAVLLLKKHLKILNKNILPKYILPEPIYVLESNDDDILENNEVTNIQSNINNGLLFCTLNIMTLNITGKFFEKINDITSFINKKRPDLL